MLSESNKFGSDQIVKLFFQKKTRPVQVSRLRKVGLLFAQKNRKRIWFGLACMLALCDCSCVLLVFFILLFLIGLSDWGRAGKWVSCSLSMPFIVFESKPPQKLVLFLVVFGRSDYKQNNLSFQTK